MKAKYPMWIVFDPDGRPVLMHIFDTEMEAWMAALGKFAFRWSEQREDAFKKKGFTAQRLEIAHG